MTTQTQQPAMDSGGKEAASAEAAPSQPDPVAISPALGPLPAIYVQRAPGEGRPVSLLWHFTAQAARLAGRWVRSMARTSGPDDPAGVGSGFGTQRDPERLAFFSDAVFAISVTLLVLEIRPPQDTGHLLHGLAALWPSYVSYAATFLLIGQVWANHHVMFDHIRSADRTVLFLNTVLLMDIAFLPFAAAVLAAALRTGQGQRTAVVFHGMAFELAAILFNVMWDYARHNHRLLGTTIDSVGARAISGRFRLALVWIATGTLLGALLPVLGMAVIAAFIPYYWLPIRGEITSAKPHYGGGQP